MRGHSIVITVFACFSHQVSCLSRGSAPETVLPVVQLNQLAWITRWNPFLHIE
ncbi:MAG: hypothetical protein H7308_00310 [Chthonomonadaceae bacterium]|nr:hypothetical protein [Chthonomonadaceae bacterium]